MKIVVNSVILIGELLVVTFVIKDDMSIPMVKAVLNIVNLVSIIDTVSIVHPNAKLEILASSTIMDRQFVLSALKENN